MKRLMLAAVLLGVTSWAIAQEHVPTTAPAGEAAPHAHASGETHPVLPAAPTWAGSMVIVVLGMFVAAAVIGVVVRLNMPEQPPEPQPHDDHGHDDHGHGGGHRHDDHSKGHGH